MTNCNLDQCQDPKRSIILQNGINGRNCIEFYGSDGVLGGTICLGPTGVEIDMLEGFMPIIEPATENFLVKQAPDGTLVDAGFPLEGRRSDTLEWVAETRGPTPGTSLDGAAAVAISGNYAFVACTNQAANNHRLAVIDISDPNNPSWVAETKGPVPASSLNGAVSIAISGNYAFIACLSGDRLAVIDISDPTSPTWVAETRGPVPGTSLDGAAWVVVSGDYALIACQNRDSLAVVDISDPTNPTWVAETRGPVPGTSLNAPASVAVSGDYALVACGLSDNLVVIDISDPTNPTWVTDTKGPVPGTSLNGAVSVAISGRYAFVACYNLPGIAVIDISDPTNPTWVAEELGPVPGTSLYFAYHIAIAGNLLYVSAYVGDKIVLVDISNPLNPTWMSEFFGPVPGTSLDNVLNVAVSGNHGFAACNGRDSLAVFGIGGLQIPSAEAGSIRTDNLDVLRDMTVAGRISTPSGISAGSLNADHGIGGSYVREHRVVDAVSADYDIDSLLAGLWVLTLEGNHAIDTLNLLPARSVFLHIIQGTVGGHTPTLTGVDWGDAGVPVWSAGVGDRDVVELFTHDSVTISGRLIGQY